MWTDRLFGRKIAWRAVDRARCTSAGLHANLFISFADPADVARYHRMVALVERMLALQRKLAVGPRRINP